MNHLRPDHPLFNSGVHRCPFTHRPLGAGYEPCYSSLDVSRNPHHYAALSSTLACVFPRLCAAPLMPDPASLMRCDRVCHGHVSPGERGLSRPLRCSVVLRATLVPIWTVRKGSKHDPFRDDQALTCGVYLAYTFDVASRVLVSVCVATRQRCAPGCFDIHLNRL